VWTLAGAYTVARSPTWNLDVLAGFRYVGVETDLKWDLRGSRDFLDTSGQVSRNLTEWDGIVGVKGQVRFGDGRWFMPYYADIGRAPRTGPGRPSWAWVTASAGAMSASPFAVCPTTLTKKDADLRMTGPALGVSFRW